MKQLSSKQTMTVKEVAEVLNCSRDTIEYTIKKLIPNKMQQGKTTYLSEVEVTAIKLELDKSMNFRNVPEVNNKTKLEKALLIKQALILQQEIIEDLTAENEQMRPKALAYDEFISTDNSISMSDVAKMLFGNEKGRNKLFAMLRDAGILQMSNNVPYQQYMKYFKVVNEVKEINGKMINIPSTRMLPSGVDYIIRRFNLHDSVGNIE